MNRFLKELKTRVLVMDGAMGTILMNNGVRPEEGFDLQVLKRPDLVRSIHRAYVNAGADIIETCTFGANRIKLEDYSAGDKVIEINTAAVTLALEAAGGRAFVCGSIGPLGKFVRPMGEVSFDEAVKAFAEQAMALESAGADCLSVETISDLQEMRAAVIAIKQSTKLPVIASLTYDENGLTVFGTPPEAAVAVLEALGADVIAANCSTGPEGLLKIAKRYLAVTKLPVMVMPNAGMPVIENDRAVYKMTPEKFAPFANKFAKLGVSIIGGCCGTTPEHIAEIRSQIRNPRSEINIKPKTNTSIFASRSKVIEVKTGDLLAIGERINPTGKKLMKEDIREGKFSIIREEAVSQTKAGAGLLECNISVPEADDKANMMQAIDIISGASPLPLSIDSPDPEVLEAGLKEFCGKALLNSVNGKKESIDRVITLAKKYGAAIIALALDEKGLPKTVAEKVSIAERIITAADRAGIPRSDIYVDALVLTAGVSVDDSLETLKTVPVIKKKFGVKTSLGISNVSHGLPGRAKINALYLKLAMLAGLDAAIVDVTSPEIKKALKEQKELLKGDRKKKTEKLTALFRKEIDKARTLPKIKEEEKLAAKKSGVFSGPADIRRAVISGDEATVRSFTQTALEKGFGPQKIIDEALVPGMETVGERFSKKIYFLPQVLSSAAAMTAGFELCKARIPKENARYAGKVLIATVRGDIHDIGKNIVKMMLENQGFEVVDLGKDVPPEKIIEAAKREKPNAVALSALLTTTMLEMKVVKEALAQAGLNVPLIVGGAVVTSDYAERIGASFGADAAQAVTLAKKIIKAAK
ncbi:MAG TPA: homocysteine S-methyltransferase family protein [Candidatus Omnitrophota bacterium]|nr:homocysteine S-methyltransferase family protein [Candidatus Omnitrophota bacterium]